MRKAEFKNVFAALCDYYGKQEDKDNLTLIEIYFDKLKFYDIEEWQLIQQELFNTIRTMPKISEIEAVSKKVLREIREQRQKEIGLCSRCGNTGFILAKIKKDEKILEYSFACSCVFGDKAAKFAKRYDSLFAKEER